MWCFVGTKVLLELVSPLTLFVGERVTVNGGVAGTTLSHVVEMSNDSQLAEKKAGHPAVPRCCSWSVSTLWTCPSSITSLCFGAAA